ncbi:hypothetical protein GCM10025857_49060 [Alicyclobacillus contaminans]|nr:hypothetical protein GCM10025857_49060 [Alicyclobacillus contaminans]
MEEYMNFYQIPRSEWQGFYLPNHTPLTQEELDSIKSLNDRISMQDVEEIYIPMCHMIHLYMKEYESLSLSKGLFLHRYIKVPHLLSELLEAWLLEKVPQQDFYRPFYLVYFPNKTCN